MFINGIQTDRIAALDRGLQYGDGLFETIAVTNGKPSCWERHIRRLHAGCERLGIMPPDPAGLLAEANILIAKQSRAVLKIIVTRGCGGRGYRPPRDSQPGVIVSTAPWPDYPDEYWTQGVRMRLCTTRLGINPALAQLKHLNRLEQVLARSEWDDPAVFEGVMLDSDGRVVEGTMSNLFLVKQGRVITPDLARCGVAGVMREQVIELADRLRIPLAVEEVRPVDLQDAEALFLTNALIGLLPVKAFAGRNYRLDAIPRALRQAVDEARCGGC